jgi:imidazoleglycerol-phosphate dehydratase
MTERKTSVRRKTNETDISVRLNLDGTGESNIVTGIGFLDHMLTLFAKHGLFDLRIRAKGDLHVDIHHTNEDVGISVGEAFKKALGDKRSIRRFGFFCVPMDEALVRVTLDISGRPSLYLCGLDSETLSSGIKKKSGYTFHDAKEFLRAFVQNSGINLHIETVCGADEHHVLEAIFKALGKALDMAVCLDPRIKGIPSTKGTI